MRSSRCTFSTAAALHRIFIAPIEHTHRRPVQVIHLTRAQAPKLHPMNRHQKRSYASLPSAEQQVNRLPRDQEIEDKMIHLVTEDNKLSPPQYTSSVLNSIDPKTHILMMVALPPERGSREEHEWPICKIVSKKALHEEKAKAKKKENPSATVKTIELNWAIDPHDLRHRLQRMQYFLAKGYRVDVVMAGKRKGKKATAYEAANVVATVKQAVAEVEGAREWRAMDGEVGKMATVFAEGKQAVK
jgi:translation initiation factor IF-3